MSLPLEQDSPAATPRRGEARAATWSPRAELNSERLRAPFSLRCGALLIDYILMVGVLAFATMLARAARPPRGDGRRAQPRAAPRRLASPARLRDRRMQTHCPNCGAETFPGARFCRRCGAHVRAEGVQETGDVSPQAATVPLREEGQGRKTDGLAPGEERASAETSRVSRADVEHLLRSQQQDAGDQNRLDPDATVAQLGRDTLVGARA